MRGMFRITKYLALGAALLAAGVGVRATLEYLLWTRTEKYAASVVTSTPAAVSPTSTPPEEKAPVPAPVPQALVTLSRASIEQSDTFAVMLSNVPLGAAPKVTWRDRTYDLLRIGERWVGFLGADAKQTPGSYTLEATIGTTTLTRQMVVAKRDFPVTALAVTPELEEKGYTPPAIQSNVVSENARLNTALIYTPIAHFGKPFVNPLDTITVVGAHGNIRKSGSVSLQHLGVDLDAVEGTPVYAINDGIVNLVEDFTNYGKTIIVDHGLGIFSYYLHLSEFNVKVGDRVTRGEVIARSGNTGYSIAPHLHFSVRIRNASVDPLRFIETANTALVSN